MTAVSRTVAAVVVILRENSSLHPTLSELHPEPATVGTLATTAGSRAFGWEPSWLFPRELRLGSSGPGPTSHLELSLGPTLARSSPIDEPLNWPKSFRLEQAFTRSRSNAWPVQTRTFPWWVSCPSSAQATYPTMDLMGWETSPARVQSVRSYNNRRSEVN